MSVCFSFSHVLSYRWGVDLSRPSIYWIRTKQTKEVIWNWIHILLIWFKSIRKFDKVKLAKKHSSHCLQLVLVTWIRLQTFEWNFQQWNDRHLNTYWKKSANNGFAFQSDWYLCNDIQLSHFLWNKWYCVHILDDGTWIKNKIK